MRRLLLGTVSVLLLLPIAGSGQVGEPRLHPDQTLPGVTLLPGYQHERYQFADSGSGRIWSEDGLDITYERNISGPFPNPVRRRGDSLWTKTQTLGTREVQITLTESRMLLIHMERPGSARGISNPLPANFAASIETEEDIVDMLLMVLQYAQE